MWILRTDEKEKINENNEDVMNAFTEGYRSTDRTHHDDTAVAITYPNAIIEQTAQNGMTRTLGNNV
jgi:hypothetical protein